jgi:EAL domain-containing protein (putative c-di-GMP-specific phosphodiesterase class I)
LNKFPLDSLKVDRSFVADLLTSSDARVVAGAIINLGRNLGLTVVAEGVEEQSQLEYLISQGCSSGQGYLFARPMPAVLCAEWLISQKGTPIQ